MSRWGIALIACAAGFAVLQARAEVAQVVLTPSVFATRTVPSGSMTTFAVTCSAGQVAVSGGVSTPGPGTTLLGIRPAGSRSYRFRLGNPGTNPARRVTVVVACRAIRISIKAQAPVLKLMQVKTRPIVVPPGGQRPASLACPGRTVPAGAGADLSASDVSVRRVSAGLRGFSFLAWNYGSKSATASFYGNCVTVVRAAGAERARLHVTLTTFSVPVQPGRQRITRSCPRGWFSLATGYRVPAARLQVEGSAAVAGGGQWWVLSNADGALLADLQLTCGQLRSS